MYGGRATTNRLRNTNRRTLAANVFSRGERSVRKIMIPKRNGKFRTIYSPDKKEKRENREWLPALRNIHRDEVGRRFRLADVCHGFVEGRSPVSNAAAHIGYKYTISMDLRDFFDSVTADKVDWCISSDMLSHVMVDGAARQGLPTSPIVANIAAIKLDEKIVMFLSSAAMSHYRSVYTRYADDLTISVDELFVVNTIIAEVERVVAERQFVLATEKTKVQSASAGRRIITGIGVDDMLHPTRKSKRKLRAMQHQGNFSAAISMHHWCKNRMPGRRGKRSIGEYIFGEQP